MTLDELKALKLPDMEVNDMNLLYVNSGIEWIADNTTLEVDADDYDSIEALPSCAKLFLVKFASVQDHESGVTAESVGRMSQNFSTDTVAKQVSMIAKNLMRKYMRSNVTFIPCGRRWKS